MEIKIKNKIKVGDQTEIIEEIHTCEVMEKGDFTYLVHHNSEKEKVVIKLNQEELVKKLADIDYEYDAQRNQFV